MFEFGRDLRKLFEKARECEDLGWLELVSAELVQIEARRETIDAGRVSCTRPFAAWLRAAGLWREHARRTGLRSSLDHAASAAGDAARSASTPDQAASAAIAYGETHLMRFDLFGDPSCLVTASTGLQALTPERPSTKAAAAALHARLRARRARISGDRGVLVDAMALLDTALQSAGRLPPAVADELRLERAALALETGVSRRDPRLLDQAGRELRALIEAASPDQRPLTRARALALAGAGMAALGGLAGDEAAALQGRALFDAAADEFTPDHSPLDWVAMVLARDEGDTALATLAQAEALCGEPGLVLGALARERRFAAETALAEATGDLNALWGLEALIRRRLSRLGTVRPLDWAADQIAMARLTLARARLTADEPRAVGLMLAEASTTAREHGAVTLVQRAATAQPGAGPRDCR